MYVHVCMYVCMYVCMSGFPCNYAVHEQWYDYIALLQLCSMVILRYSMEVADGFHV